MKVNGVWLPLNMYFGAIHFKTINSMLFSPAYLVTQLFHYEQKQHFIISANKCKSLKEENLSSPTCLMQQIEGFVSTIDFMMLVFFDKWK